MLGREHTVFVYGTLRSHEPNHHLLHKAKKVATQCYAEGSLYDTGCGYPAMVEELGRVYGELYKVNDRELKALDALEDYHGEGLDNLYNRVRRSVHTDQGLVEAFVYVWGKGKELLREEIQHGDWKRERLLEKEELNLDEGLFYFAYGSAMDDQRFKEKGVEQWFECVVGRGVLPGFSLRFTRKSADGGRADLVEVGERVEGKIYKVGREAVKYLYAREGVALAIYRPTFVEVAIDGKLTPNVLTFIVANKDEETSPPLAYVREMVRGGKGIVGDAYMADLIGYLQREFGMEINEELLQEGN